MKKLLPLFILLSSCAVTVPYYGDVVDKCRHENYGKYYGNCIWEAYEYHQNKDSYLEKHNYRTLWREITEVNRQSIEALQNNTLSVAEANTYFNNAFSKIVNADNARVAREQKAQQKALQDMSDAFKRAGDQLSGRSYGYGSGSSSIPNVGSGSSRTSTGFFSHEVESGMGKICYYDVLGTVKALNKSAASICPISAKFPK